MADNDKNDFRKGIPGGFIWIVLAAFMLALMVQSLVDTKVAGVSFSYQLEHLVNLQLIQPEDSKKIALNDNLVTFSGKFRDKLTDDGRKRYKYLELLSGNQDLTNEKQRLETELAQNKDGIIDSATRFVQLSSIAVPQHGLNVIDDFWNTSTRDNSITLQNIPASGTVSITDIRKKIDATNTPTAAEADAIGQSLTALLSNYRSPQVGIGSEQIKQTLRQIDTRVLNATQSESTPTEKLQVYRDSIAQLEGVVSDINTIQDHVRFLPLRSVRNYVESLKEYDNVVTQLEENYDQLDKARRAVSHVIWFFNGQELSTKALEKQDAEKFSQWFLNAKEEWDSFAENKAGSFKAPDQPLNTVLEKTFKSEEPSPNYVNYLFTFLPIIIVVLVLYFLFTRQMRGAGNSAMNFGKSPAKLLMKGQTKVTFKDVAGVDEAKEELQEVVEFLRNPSKFTTLGGHIPKGVLLVGAPGTGKTLIAKAVAGEADRPFFSISGSDFVEMFVGVGASRIRDMFDTAKKNAPCIVFIDEIDAVGRHRGAGIGGGHDEREQTLNQLLVEMDGFDTNEGVILMAATNRPDVLDKALLRPGRFDRRVVIDMPDIKGRYDILKVHAKRIKLDPSVDLMAIARATPGASGADLMNLLNEAALLAARRGRTAVTQQETSEARDKVLFGKERRSLELDENEKKTTAYHEAGHTVVALYVEHADPVEKVTIIPRGMSLGATMFLPRKNRVSYWKRELLDQLAVLMGGRVAEEIFVKDVSSGARQDFEQATSLARSMVCEWGMSDDLGTVAYDEKSSSGQYLGMQSYHEKKYSEETARAIDKEVRQLLDSALNRARDILNERSDATELMAQMLIEFETLDAEDVKAIMDGKWDIEHKKRRIKEMEESHKKQPLTPPPPPPRESAEGSSLETKNPPAFSEG
jgi:cell division protease FtsH